MVRKTILLLALVLVACSGYNEKYGEYMGWIRAMPCTLGEVNGEIVYILKVSDINTLGDALTQKDVEYIRSPVEAMYNRVIIINTFYYEWKIKIERKGNIPYMPSDFHPVVVINDTTDILDED